MPIVDGRVPCSALGRGMMINQLDRDELVTAAYQAGTDPSRWSNLIELLDKKLDSVYLSLYGHDTTTGVFLESLTSKYSDEFMSQYGAHFGQKNLFIPVLMNAPTMEFRYSEEWVARDTLMKSEFYGGFLAPQEDIVSGGGGVLFNEDGRVLILSGQVRRQDEEGKTPEFIETIRFIAPHIKRAFEIQRALAGQSLNSTAYQAELNRLEHAVFLIDSNGLPTHWNSTAEGIVRSGELCTLQRSRRLKFIDLGAEKLVQSALASIRLKKPDGPAPAFVARSHNSNQYIVSVSRFDTPEDTHVPFHAFSVLGTPTAIMTIRGSTSGEQSIAGLLASTFGVTPAETDLAIALLSGVTLSEYAHHRGVSKHTVRNQLKSLFQKTDTNSQVQLLASLRRFSLKQ